MNLQIDYLRTFLALAKAKNFTKTGVQVNLSQSVVSMQIKRIEIEVDKKLFHRIGKTVKLCSEENIRFGSPEHYTVGVSRICWPAGR